jgi:hypothetical protein
MEPELQKRTRTPEEQAAWEEWVKTGKGSPPGFVRGDPPSEALEKLKVLISVAPRRKKKGAPTKGSPQDFEEAAKVLGNGITAEDARKLHELFTGQ